MQKKKRNASLFLSNQYLERHSSFTLLTYILLLKFYRAFYHMWHVYQVETIIQRKTEMKHMIVSGLIWENVIPVGQSKYFIQLS